LKQLLFGILLLAGSESIAQDSTATAISDTAHTYPQMDIVDFFRSLFKRNKIDIPVDTPIKGTLPNSNFTYTLLPAVGYTLQTRLAVILAGNVTFKTSDLPDQKLSSVYANVAFTQNRQFTVPIQTNLWSKNNRYNFVGDLRYMIYPQSTFGLGGNNDKVKDENKMTFTYLRFYETVLKEVKKDFYAGIGYMLDYRWNISEQGHSDGRTSDFELYGAQSKSVASGLALSMLFDNRPNAIYPLRGFYASATYRYNPTWMGSNSQWQSLLLDMRKYFQLSKRMHRVLAFWSYNWIVTQGNPPYLDLPSTAWDAYTNTGRGFIQGRFRSKKMLYIESEFRTDITRNGLLGAVVFANLQSFDEWPTGGFQYLQPAAGFGLRIKLNRISDTNVTIDYGFGKGGSQGLFINVGEIF
jgi:hypothetical protein